MNYCNTCNASHKNTVERVIRCGTCVVRPMQTPSKWKPADATKEQP